MPHHRVGEWQQRGPQQLVARHRRGGRQIVLVSPGWCECGGLRRGRVLCRPRVVLPGVAAGRRGFLLVVLRTCCKFRVKSEKCKVMNFPPTWREIQADWLTC